MIFLIHVLVRHAITRKKKDKIEDEDWKCQMGSIFEKYEGIVSSFELDGFTIPENPNIKFQRNNFV